MKLNLSIEWQSTIKARATTDRTLLLRLSTPSRNGERPLGVLLNFLSHTRTHSRKGTIVISGWKGLIYFAGLKERMYGPVMTCGLAANNEDSIRAGQRQDAISHYIRYISLQFVWCRLPLFLESVESWNEELASYPLFFSPRRIRSFNIERIHRYTREQTSTVSQTKWSLLFSIFFFSISSEYKWQLELG